MTGLVFYCPELDDIMLLEIDDNTGICHCSTLFAYAVDYDCYMEYLGAL